MSEEAEQREQGRDVAGLVFLAVTGLAIVSTLVWFAIRADRAMQSELADARQARAGRKPCRCHETAEGSSPVGDDTESEPAGPGPSDDELYAMTDPVNEAS